MQLTPLCFASDLRPLKAASSAWQVARWRLQPQPRPCSQVCAHARASMRTALICFTFDVWLTTAVVMRHCLQARCPAGADGLEEEILDSSLKDLRTTMNESVQECDR